ncbi:hypothetical protein U1Q18_031750, partial [Sarracenia purpurea var. burkii]
DYGIMLSSKELREEGESPKASEHRDDIAIIDVDVVSPLEAMAGRNAKDNTHASKLKHNKGEGTTAVVGSTHYHEYQNLRCSDWSEGKGGTRQYTKRKKKKAI